MKSISYRKDDHHYFLDLDRVGERCVEHINKLINTKMYKIQR